MNSLAFLDVDPSILKTEERIIVAAIKVFADYPLQVATVRMIAQEAQINFSSITYHFKTKENLYQEVLRRFLNNVVQLLPSPDELAVQPLTPELARKELLAFVGQATDLMYGNSHTATFAKIILREHFSPSPFYEMLYKEFFSKVITWITARVCCLINVPENVDKEREATLITFSIIGQILGFRVGREMLIRRLGFTGFSTEEIAELKELLMRNILRQLGLPS